MATRLAAFGTSIHRIKSGWRAIAIVAVALICVQAATAQTRILVWSDEFDGPAGSTIDPTKWTSEVGGGGFGNRELQYYTDGDNAALDGDGNLVITADEAQARYRCWYGDCRYTSARIKTRFLFEQEQGRFEARIKIPYGQGLWPAFWMLGNNISTVGWPMCGEIDIMENIGREPDKVHGTVHGPGYSGGGGIGGPYTLDAGSFSDDFHVFAAEWTTNRIDFFVDDTLYKTVTPDNLPPGRAWVFDHPFYMILNVAVGGNWPGDPDATTVFPQTMLVDYVRVYKLDCPPSSVSDFQALKPGT